MRFAEAWTQSVVAVGAGEARGVQSVVLQRKLAGHLGGKRRRAESRSERATLSSKLTFPRDGKVVTIECDETHKGQCGCLDGEAGGDESGWEGTQHGRRGYQKGTSCRASQTSPASPARMTRLMPRMM